MSNLDVHKITVIACFPNVIKVNQVMLDDFLAGDDHELVTEEVVDAQRWLTFFPGASFSVFEDAKKYADKLTKSNIYKIEYNRDFPNITKEGAIKTITEFEANFKIKY